MADLTNPRLTEMLETLAGARAGTPTKAAVRLEDLLPLLELPTSLKSKAAAGAAPTKAEFDALRLDVQTMLLRLAAVVQLLQAHVIK